MPQGAWSPKRDGQYEYIKESGRQADPTTGPRGSPLAPSTSSGRQLARRRPRTRIGNDLERSRHVPDLRLR